MSNPINYALVMLMLLLTAQCTPPTPGPSGPDLVIQSFAIADEDWFLGSFSASAVVVVKNMGAQPASAFEVGIVGVNRQDKHVSLGFVYEPTPVAELAPGAEVTLHGEIGLGWHGHFDVCCTDAAYDATCCVLRNEDTLWLVAIADYCLPGDAPAHCVVEEVDETNNATAPIVVERAK
jgi:hypothetical protein